MLSSGYIAAVHYFKEALRIWSTSIAEFKNRFPAFPVEHPVQKLEVMRRGLNEYFFGMRNNF